MFEDFENRMGFWKNLGSNFTINYSGDEPSFMSDGEMWASIGPNAGTKTLAEWEDGYVLINNPDGTITANPKYTSGLDPETLVRVPIGPQSPTAMFPSTGGGVVVTGYGAENKTFAATATIPSLKEIYENGHPYVKEFTIGSSATGVSFPEDDTVQIMGHNGTYFTGSDYDPVTKGQINRYGTVLRVIPAEGYQVFVGGYVGKGFGRSIESKDLPYKRSIHLIGPDGTKYMPTKAAVNPTGTGSGSSSGSSSGSGSGSGNGSGSGSGGSNGSGSGNGTDPNDCANEKRAVNTDTTCGDCLSGYTEDTAGVCIADEPEEEEKKTNWLLWGGIAAVAAFAFMGR